MKLGVRSQNLPSIQVVIAASKVADLAAGLAHLGELDNLRYLSVWQTRVSDAGIDALKKKLPRLRVNK